jgi:hypothetical protein
MAKKFDAKAKAKRQKIILAVLGVVFIGVLAWQVPSVLKMMNEKPPPTATPPPAAAPLPGTPVVGTPVSVPGTPVPAGTLADSDPAAQAAGGQLVTFDRFESKDPFAQQLSDKPAPAPQDDAPADVPASGQSGGSAPKPPPAPAPASAEITVNGSKETVSVGGTFPQADPVFVLVSVTKTTAKVGISGGSLATGTPTVTLNKGKTLTLENTVDGARYTLLLVTTR